ncbi:MAG: ATP-binding protein [Candidatus Helarchaeota archaeon]
MISKYFDHSIEEIMTWSRDKFIEIIHPDDREHVLNILFSHSISKMKERLQHISYRTISGSGDVKWFEAYAKIIHYKGEEAILVTILDVTEKREAELRLIEAKEKERIEAILETIPDGIFVINKSGQIIMSNKTFLEIYKKIFKQELPDDINILEISNSRLFKEIKNQIGSNTPKTTTIEPLRGYHLQLDFKKLKLTGDDEPNTIVILHDVTSFVEFDNLRKQFVSTVSHELRTPISVIHQSLSNLNKYKDRMTEGLKRELLKVMTLNADILTEIIEDLLVISSIDEKRIKFEWKRYDILDLITRVLTQLEPKRQKNNVRIVLELNESIYLQGDSHKISQIFRILIDNAIKYSPNNSKIIINVIDMYLGEYNKENLDGVLIQVIDNGMGIREDELPYIFERFYRCKDVSEIPGTGLGLPIAQELAKLHCGKIFVQSELGKGSIFSVFLPKLDKPPI